jgi:methionyl-tRNA formyltransferase
LRVVFAGTPPFAARALQALARAGHDIPLVLTQPDRPSGRGLKLTASAVSQTATHLGLRLEKPLSLRDPTAHEPIREVHCDVMVVAAYGLLLPQAVLDIPARGCINIHASLLPRWRGAAPIQRAILAGDAVTGISIMSMEAGLDTGPVLLTHEVPIAPRATTGTLTEALADAGAEAIVAALASLDRLAGVAQDESRATYAAKVRKGEARIDWTRSNLEIDRQVRAFDPAPGAEAQLGGEAIKIWSAEPVAGSAPPGSWLSHRAGEAVVACGSGGLRLLEIQRPASRRMPAEAFFRGNPASLALPWA